MNRRITNQEEINLDMQGRLAGVEGTVETHTDLLESFGARFEALNKEVRGAKLGLWVMVAMLTLHDSGISLGVLFRAFTKLITGL